MGKLADNFNNLQKSDRIYRLHSIVYYLLEAEQFDRLYQLLTDPDFPEIKRKELSLPETAADYRQVIESGCFQGDRLKELEQIHQDLIS
jgi:hypothetical protein